MRTNRKTIGVIPGLMLMICALLVAVTPVSRAEDFENPKPGAPKWKVFDYNRVQTHPARVPDKIPGGIAFDFLYTPDTAVLATSHPSYRGDLLGDLTGKTVTARVGVTITNGNPHFTYFGEPDACGRPANVRFFFQTDTSGKFQETDYWWSNPMSVDLEDLKASDQTLVAQYSDPSQWSDVFGHSGADPAYTAAFIEAVKDVQLNGLSFGGGCFFQNGVGIQPGTGSGKFRLMDFSITP
jgi:hypothetical protein